ncbi:TetR/AcrR family transcriptional regulator [Glaciibacter superstes]|uniref:TetR/AcrR family transcriptional regulator n=1 Tax=Glaciibacter superstes TaxID=501023 RepID=UPI0003B47512|nr:TetR/AcrR family transcriptional regulator [Glaciibacter superstes]
MSIDEIFEIDAVEQTLQIRTEPVQRRSSERLTTLLDAAASVVDEVGFARITTAMIAERAGASIGTVYRYYPDRVAVLHALRERAVQRFRARVADELRQRDPKTWWEAVDCAVTAFVALYRSEAGFRILRFAERERTPLDGDSDLDAGYFARGLAEVLAEEFGLPGGNDLIFRLEVVVEMAEALLTRAFATNPHGDDRFIAECRRIIHDYLAGFYGQSTAG